MLSRFCGLESVTENSSCFEKGPLRKPVFEMVMALSPRLNCELVLISTFSAVNCFVEPAICALTLPEMFKNVAPLAGWPEAFKSMITDETPSAPDDWKEMPGLLNGSCDGGPAIKSVPLSSPNE